MNRQQLQARWEGEDARITLILAALRAGKPWAELLGPFQSGGVDHGPLPLLDRVGADGSDLRGIRLENQDLSQLRIDGANLEFAEFFSVTLRGAIMSSEERVSNLASASFIHCHLEHAQFQGGICNSARFSHCALSNADFSGAKLDGAILRASNLRGANLTRASLRDVDYIHSDLRHVAVSPETVILDNRALAPVIRLEDQALRMDFDRFQFADRNEALRSAAIVYSQLAEAYEHRGLTESAKIFRIREHHCLEQASQSSLASRNVHSS